MHTLTNLQPEFHHKIKCFFLKSSKTLLDRPNANYTNNGTKEDR